MYAVKGSIYTEKLCSHEKPSFRPWKLFPRRGKALKLAFYAHERRQALFKVSFPAAIGSAILLAFIAGKQVAKHLGISLFLPNYPRRHWPQ
jgi:hypothetical protein